MGRKVREEGRWMVGSWIVGCVKGRGRGRWEGEVQNVTQLVSNN